MCCMQLRNIKTFDMALPVSKYGKKFCLALASSDSSAAWVFRTDTESDFIRWRDALRHAIDAARPAPSSRHALSPLQTNPHSSVAHTPPPTGGGRQQEATRPSVDIGGANGADGGGAGRGDGRDREAATCHKTFIKSGGGGGLKHNIATAETSVDEKQVKGSAMGQRVEGEEGEEGGGIEQHYSVGRMLDKGSNGSVYAGVDNRTGERVAIKIIDVEGGSLEGEGQKDIWLQVQHENMVRLLDYYKTASKLYFVMELATGKDLFYGVMQHYHSHRPQGFSEKEACQLTWQVLNKLNRKPTTVNKQMRLVS
jgi:hypothetical protein